MPTLSQAEAEGVGEAEAEGEEEAISVKKISVIIVKIMDTGNVIVERNNVTRDTIEDSSKPNLMIRRCTTLNPATLLPTAEEGHQHNCLDEVSTKVLPRPDLNSTPQEPIQPGDYVWVKKFVRKRWNTPRWEGPYQVKAREQWRTLRKRLTACIGPATAEPRRNL
ncbi:hypothetical protein D4764_20G0006470 [Takifugu flavidus]|uniref:Murine leukemia virus integrase C-terminal domain-containing protein n=1 Tax=Takifugu flavidus TaxID=433684 RepID=A0A5C6NI72_9TELE|nr:hypothetical protein D4764_20G0006470 [Takifugu flavidus]